jgi:uncharacterized membrane protein
MRLPRLAPRIAISLPLSGLFLAARAAGDGEAAAALAAALIAAMLAPAAGAAGIAGCAAAAGLGALAWASGPGGAEAVLAALPLAGSLALAWHFGRTLRPGQEPLITRYTRADIGAVSPAVMRYTRRLTLAWTGLFLAFAAVAAATLAGLGPPAGPSAAVTLGVSVLAFLGEHAVRARRFPELGPVRPARTLRAIWRVDAVGHAR